MGTLEEKKRYIDNEKRKRECSNPLRGCRKSGTYA